MADYQLTKSDDYVIRTADRATIPNDPLNMDRVAYDKWLEDGGVPDPYVEPEKLPPAPTLEQTLAFDHENRIRVLEGEPPLTMADFVSKKLTPK